MWKCHWYSCDLPMMLYIDLTLCCFIWENVKYRSDSIDWLLFSIPFPLPSSENSSVLLYRCRGKNAILAATQKPQHHGGGHYIKEHSSSGLFLISSAKRLSKQHLMWNSIFLSMCLFQNAFHRYDEYNKKKAPQALLCSLKFIYSGCQISTWNFFL